MVNTLNQELRNLENETFEVVDLVDLGLDVAADVSGREAELVALDWTSSSCSTSSCCSCSTSSCCSTSTSSGCGGN